MATDFSAPVELTNAELDAVAAGANAGAGAGGLVALALAAAVDNVDVDILNNNKVTVQNVANNNQVGAGVLINVLGGPAAIRNF